MVKITLITGNGKGKTSTAIGHVYLEQNKGKEIVIAQFLKTGNNCGECNFINRFYKTRWFNFGKKEFYVSDTQLEEFRDIVGRGITKLTDELNNVRTDILLLDELGIALSYNLVKWEDLLSITEAVNEEIIITGRKTPEIIKNKIDEIIQIEEIKHPYNDGIVARKGIDY